jgi:hypothetical protein
MFRQGDVPNLSYRSGIPAPPDNVDLAFQAPLERVDVVHDRGLPQQHLADHVARLDVLGVDRGEAGAAGRPPTCVWPLAIACSTVSTLPEKTSPGSVLNVISTGWPTAT